MSSPAKTAATKPVSQAALSTDDREAKTDRYGELDLQIQRFAPIVAEHEALKAEIEGWFESHPADQPAIAKGARGQVQLTARKLERTITNPRKAFALLRKAVGSLDAAIACITIPLGAAVDKFIPKSLHSQFLKQEQTGGRTLKYVPNA